MKKECEHLLDYLAGELSETEQNTFIRHLQTCTKCNTDYQQLSDVWSFLPHDIEEKQVPESLKSEVLDFVYNHDQKNEQILASFNLKEWGRIFKRQFTPLTTSLVLIMLVLVVGLGTVTIQLSNNQENEISQPIEVLYSQNLKAADPNATETNGNATIVKQGSKKKLVVQVNNLPPLEGSNVYQVWLLKDGKRTNAGIFKPAEQGSGILTYQLSKNQSFDGIGITMEPDENSILPKGKKIVGT